MKKLIAFVLTLAMATITLSLLLQRKLLREATRKQEAQQWNIMSIQPIR